MTRWPLGGGAAMLMLIGALTLGGCGGGDDHATATATPTPPPGVTATRTSALSTPTLAGTPTATPSNGAVSGLALLQNSIGANAGDALGAPPMSWPDKPVGPGFDRAFSNADWFVIERPDVRGTTAADGTFTISGLPAGRYTLQLGKTVDGNLITMQVPIVIGGGSTQVLLEIAWGLVRTVSSYDDNGVQVREIHGPSGTFVVVRDGRIASFGDSFRTFADADGDGQFDVQPCASGPLPVSGICSADVCPGGRCVCVASCPECDDCAKLDCMPAECTPVEISGLTVSAPSELVVGQSGNATATLQLSDGSGFDMTTVVTWSSSDSGIATIDDWGNIIAVAVGSTGVGASIAAFDSAPATLDVVSRPTLQQITIQNANCLYPVGLPPEYGAGPPTASVPGDMAIRPPACGEVLAIGDTIQLRAVGQFANGYYQDITDEVQWSVTPSELGSIPGGLFTATAAGTGEITAVLEGVSSDPSPIKVVDHPTLVSLSIYSDRVLVGVDRGGPPPPAGTAAMPCPLVDQASSPCCCPGPIGSLIACLCPYNLTVLVGDTLQFHASAYYDTGAYRDVTDEVTWRSNNAAAATIDPTGLMTAAATGEVSIDAVLDDVTSNPVGVEVVDHATLQSLFISQQGNDLVVSKGDQRFFTAAGSYDLGFSRDVTTAATWHSSDNTVGGFDTPGVFTGRRAGNIVVWAELDGQQSNQISLEVFETSELSYCDPAHVNRSVWSDDYDRVTLESDCANYSQPGIAALRYTVTELQPHGGIFDPCLDLYVADAAGRPVRTVRQEGCGMPFIPGNAPDAATQILKYQLRAFWDLKDNDGVSVPAGQYVIYGRFYLYYDPVVTLNVTVLQPGQPTPTPAPAGICSYGDRDAMPCMTDADCPGGQCVPYYPTPPPVCTPPPCAPGGVLYCPSHVCPGGCGYACAMPTPSAIPPPPPLSLLVGSASAAPGTTVTIDVSLSDADGVVGVQNDLTFTPAVAIGANPDGGPACTVNPDIGKDGHFAFVPAGCMPGSTCTGVRVLVFSLTNTDPLPSVGRVYTCTLLIADGAAGDYKIGVENAVASDAQGRALPLYAAAGVVHVVRPGEATSTPQPTWTPAPICDPLPCAPGEVLFCPGFCPHNCGLVCATPTPTPAGAAALIGNATTAVAGDLTKISLRLAAPMAAVAGTQNDLSLDPELTFTAGADGRPACVVNPAINKPASAFAFLPSGCSPASACTGVRAIVLDFTDLSPIADGSTLYTCAVQVAAGASTGPHAVHISNPVLSDPTGQRVPVTTADGIVTVTRS